MGVGCSAAAARVPVHCYGQRSHSPLQAFAATRAGGRGLHLLAGNALGIQWENIFGNILSGRKRVFINIPVVNSVADEEQERGLQRRFRGVRPMSRSAAHRRRVSGCSRPASQGNAAKDDGTCPAPEHDLIAPAHYSQVVWFLCFQSFRHKYRLS